MKKIKILGIILILIISIFLAACPLTTGAGTPPADGEIIVKLINGTAESYNKKVYSMVYLPGVSLGSFGPSDWIAFTDATVDGTGDVTINDFKDLSGDPWKGEATKKYDVWFHIDIGGPNVGIQPDDNSGDVFIRKINNDEMDGNLVLTIDYADLTNDLSLF